MSVNHQYIELQDTVFKRYHKTEIAALSGKRLNPHNLAEQVYFLLTTPEHCILYKTVQQGDNEVVEFSGRTKELDYEQEVLEIYSDKEDVIFRTLNKVLFERGLLVEYAQQANPITTANALNDAQIDVIAKNPNIRSFKKHLEPITSPQTLQRIKLRLIEFDRPLSFINIVEAHTHYVSS